MHGSLPTEELFFDDRGDTYVVAGQQGMSPPVRVPGHYGIDRRGAGARQPSERPGSNKRHVARNHQHPRRLRGQEAGVQTGERSLTWERVGDVARSYDLSPLVCFADAHEQVARDVPNRLGHVSDHHLLADEMPGLVAPESPARAACQNESGKILVGCCHAGRSRFRAKNSRAPRYDDSDPAIGCG